MSERRAASVLLTRVGPGGVEAYLVERSTRLRFFGGYLAFPGGVVGDGDAAAGDEATALRACALRELFEETGVLVPPLSQWIEDDARDELRERLLADDGAGERWQRLLRRSAAPFDACELVCTMTTPDFAPVRYETAFFHVELPANEWPSVLPGELTGGTFKSPGEAVREWLEGEVLIAPPVLAILKTLDRVGPSGFYDAIREETERYAAGELHPVYFTPGVLMAPLRTPTLLPATTTNCYLVGHRRVFVVDPATWDEREQQRLFALLDAWRDEGRELAGILATHHHEDHVGAIVPVSQRYGLTVYGHPLTLERLPDGAAATQPIDDGDRIELGRAPDGAEDWHLRVLHTPGHDRGHLAFFESRYRSVIAGDLLSTVSTIVIDPPEGHLETYLASLRRLLDEPVRTLYPAHGPAARDAHALVREYLAHRQDREDALLEALRPSPRSVSELVAEVYTDVDPGLHGLAARSLLAGLEKLADEGRAFQEGGRRRRAE